MKGKDNTESVTFVSSRVCHIDNCMRNGFVMEWKNIFNEEIKLHLENIPYKA